MEAQKTRFRCPSSAAPAFHFKGSPQWFSVKKRRFFVAPHTFAPTRFAHVSA
jgi:hypothetical protein